LLLAACESNPIYGRATFETQLDSLLVQALTGTPLGSLSALNVATRTVSRAETSSLGTITFDIVFDVEAGKVKLYPAKLIAFDARGVNNRIVGMLKSSRPFDQVTEAPTGGYQYDSVLVANVGETVIVNTRSDFCSGAFLPDIYAKLVVDSITPQRLMYVRLASDPNCGFRGLVPGEVPRK
jgi:hypothetical protein